MDVDHVPCGEFVNESERLAVQAILSKLRSAAQGQRWILLTNVPHSVNAMAIPDEIDLIAVGSTGLFVIETKHWGRAYLRDNQITVKAEAVKLNEKIKRLATKIRRAGFDPGFIAGRFLLTKEKQPWKSDRPVIHGSKFFGISELRELLDLKERQIFEGAQVEELSRLIQPLVKVTLAGELRRIGNVRNLELCSPRAERFHRVYRGQHVRTRDRVIVHLFDLSASDDPHAERLAFREFDALHRLQRTPSVPRLVDSPHELPEYPGELCYFSFVDPAAPTLLQRVQDATWTLDQRLRFAANSLIVLEELHSYDFGATKFAHRNISPNTLLVGANDQPIFIGFHWSRVAATSTISHAWQPSGAPEPWLPPEVRKHGLAQADQRSDTFSLCGTLSTLFDNCDEPRAHSALATLAQGMEEEPDARHGLTALADHFQSAAGLRHPSVPPARFWSEGLEVTFNQQSFRIVSELGTGSNGTTYKVIELNQSQEGGTFVGKVAFDEKIADKVLRAYRRARPFTKHSNLATIFEVAPQWQDSEFIALMNFVQGTTLNHWTGLVELYAEELGDPHPSVLVSRWLTKLCAALANLHRAGLVHGDVSPKNILDASGEATLTDYDLVLGEGEAIWCIGTPTYAAPESTVASPASASNDIFSLAASLFHVMFDREPFWHGGNLRHERGLNWDGLLRAEWSWIADFLDRATSPNVADRFANADHALAWIDSQMPRASTPPELTLAPELPSSADPLPMNSRDHFTRQQVPWLGELLATYPGSPRGKWDPLESTCRHASLSIL